MAEYSDLDVSRFGATGDGGTDDTAAIQAAIDAAAEVQGTLLFPPGTYCCSTLRMHSQVGLFAHPAWTYRGFGGAVLKLTDDKARCLIDMTGAIGCTLNGLSICGADRMGEGIHGVMVDKPDYGKQEDNPRIERCRIGEFSGDAVHLNRIWCFSVRHCMLSWGNGNGLWVRGWDGFVLDNWFSGHRGAGYAAYEESAAVTMTGNRVEWNGAGGIVIHDGTHYNICNNYIDRSGGPGICVLPNGDYWGKGFSVTGNLINRSGKPNTKPGDCRSAQMHFERCRGLTVTGNTMTVGRDDGNKGDWSPDEGIAYGALQNSVITANVMQDGALKELMVDLRGHGEGVVVRDNPGCLFTP
jgi:hypothetical protein